jgi:hypothetical protein
MITLRKLNKENLSQITDWFNDPETKKYIQWNGIEKGRIYPEK